MDFKSLNLGRYLTKRHAIVAVGFVFVLAITSLFFSSDSRALTGADVTESMTTEEAVAFNVGALDMYALHNPEKAVCALTWFHDNDGGMAVFRIYEEFPDKPAVAVIQVLIDRECPD